MQALPVDNSGRDFHGALLDAQLLADVYLAMTGGQGALSLEATPAANAADVTAVGENRPRRADSSKSCAVRRPKSRRTSGSSDLIADSCAAGALWRKLD